MADEKKMADFEKANQESLEPEERRYVFPPHPEPGEVLSKAMVSPEEPITAQDPLFSLIHLAVEGLRVELKAEMETRVRELQTDFRAELQKELLKERNGGLEPNAKN